VRLDEQLALAHCVLGYARLLSGRAGEAIEALERALELDPSLAVAHAWMGDALLWPARTDEAIVSVQKAMRISPRDPMMWSFLNIMGAAHCIAGRYEESLGWLQRSLQLRPGWPPTLIYTVSSYAHLGRLDEASEALEGLLQLSPALSVSRVSAHLTTAEFSPRELLIDGLRKAGLKE
jgi:tetratricopeptide (TPR) repeat protein